MDHRWGRAAVALLTAAALGMAPAGAAVLRPAGGVSSPEVTDLRVDSGLRLDGAAGQDAAGRSAAPIGDVNGDDLDDMVLGVPGADFAGRDGAGAVYVIFGSDAPPASIDLAALGSRGFRISGATTGDRTGTAVAGAGDINDDGFDDVLIGAPGAGFNTRAESGSVYVVYGGPAPADLDLATPGGRTLRIDGALAGDRIGSAVSDAGDVNGDGWLDVTIGAPAAGSTGSAYVVFGPCPAGVDLAVLGAGGLRFTGAATGDAAGTAVDAIGDVNEDGRDDVLIGAPGAGFNARPSSGSTYLVYGIATSGTVGLETLGTGGVRIDGASATDDSGSSLDTGDVNGDDLLDILIGAPHADRNGRTDSGSAYAVFGTANPVPVDLAALGTAGIRVDGAQPGDLNGYGVTALDLDGDSTDDLVSSAVGADHNGRAQSGSVYAVLGGATAGSRDLGSARGADLRFDGAGAGDQAGTTLATVGDLNDDAGVDLAIGAPAAGNNGRAGSGSLHLVFGLALDSDPDAATPESTGRLKVKARKAGKAIPRTGRTALVRTVTVGSRQQARVRVKVRPRRTRAKTTVIKQKSSVVVRTRRAPRGRITVRIRATGPGLAPIGWSRTWRVR